MAKITRRRFLHNGAKSGLFMGPAQALWSASLSRQHHHGGFHADIAIIGGSLGGCSAALAALRRGHRVVLTEETAWVGGQLTSQGVPPDEHSWIETMGANTSYRELRHRIRNYYRRHYPLIPSEHQRSHLNPGKGSVSRLCHEPRVALAVLQEWMAPFLSNGQLIVLTYRRPVSADVDGEKIRAIEVLSLLSGRHQWIEAPVFLDATELGDLLPLVGARYVTGSESRAQTHEMHASEVDRPDNQQAFTMCLAMEHLDGEDHTISPPRRYSFWRRFMPELEPAWPGKLLDWTYTHPRSMEPRLLGFNPSKGTYRGVLNLWDYRRMIAKSNFQAGTFRSDISLINWPQNDYFLGSIINVSRETFQAQIEEAKQLSLSLLHWLQTEAPRHDSGLGYPGLRLRPDIMGTEDGLSMYPYVRESRRIHSIYTITEKDCGLEQRMAMTGQSRQRVRAAVYHDSVGVGSYPIDLHPSTEGDNYIDFESLPFQLPLGALIPEGLQNLIPACKNIGTTHVTNGCYRLHPVEWGIGEVAGSLGAVVKERGESTHSIRNNPQRLASFQSQLAGQGVAMEWPESIY
jgi:hypothetical protein